MGTVRLEQYLRDSGELTPLTVAQLLDEQDWQVFEQRYAATGRTPYATRAMMGLILYGIMQGVHSLRALEGLARLDLGCMWVAGGITPDHAIIGRFIVLHAASLTHEFFESLTRTVLRACRSSNQRVAGDGTVIEAACSHYKLLEEQAVKAQTEAQRTFSQRKAMVEPVFATLRYQQKLDRFRRRGLCAVKCEFALHAMAYNLARAVRLLRGLFAYFYVICHVQHAQRRLVYLILIQQAVIRRRYLLATP